MAQDEAVKQAVPVLNMFCYIHLQQSSGTIEQVDLNMQPSGALTPQLLICKISAKAAHMWIIEITVLGFSYFSLMYRNYATFHNYSCMTTNVYYNTDMQAECWVRELLKETGICHVSF